MNPFFSVITPTLQRDSLVRCCESVDNQTGPLWEHIVIVDSEMPNDALIEECGHIYRKFMFCGTRHGNYGNHCRHMGWELATGKYLIGLDDDNALADNSVLEDMAAALRLAQYPDWAIFPILRHGHYFSGLPPGLCMTDTLNLVVKREIGRWPDIAAREADGVLIEQLKLSHPNYATFPYFRPVGIMEYSSNGQ